MKELTIEEKAKRYDKALKVAKGIYAKDAPDSLHLEKMFPELKESEDERIRNGLMKYFRAGKCENVSSYHGISTNDILAWLEKQGEQKPTDKVEWELHETIKQKPAWSEKDEVKINRIVACLENLNVADNDILLKDVDWLKSLKDRVQPKQEWSEKDEKALKDTIRFCELCGNKVSVNWLKSLRPQKQ